MFSSLSEAERLKFRLLAEGLAFSGAARDRLDEIRGSRKLTPADYASTTGLILRLEDDVWVNAPYSEHNPNFVSDSHNVLDACDDGFVIHSDNLESSASVWLPPKYHDENLSSGRPTGHFAFTHGDRVRLSPIQGCAMRCKFCNIPYEDRYETKPVDSMIEVLDGAFDDPLQPAQHLLISGGTPARRDIAFLQEVYERILTRFAERHVDIMMVPVEGLFDLPRLKELGLNELSINIELFNPVVARKLMPQKFKQTIDHYLDFIAEAVDVLGQGRVRSMIMVGLEPVEDTIAAVRSVVKAGGVPVLSPFRPDPATPLKDVPTLTSAEYEEIFLRATDAAASLGGSLGPDCPPCTHNTLTLVESRDGAATYPHRVPLLV